jgi:5-methylcytosine-specific restriction endonuclease McrA
MVSRRPPSNLPGRGEIFLHWKDRLGELGLFVDWGEPSCWACGFHYDDKYDVPSPQVTLERIVQCWERIPLQKCHIVPKSLGGADTADNLFLMCRECHDRAPNTPFPEIFFEWARAQSSSRRESAKIEEALRSLSVPEDMRNVIEAALNSPEFGSWVSGKIGLHWPQSNYPSRSSRLTPATLIGLAKRYLTERGKP